MLVEVCLLGQTEIVEWLTKKRSEGDDSFHAPKVIFEGMIKDGLVSKKSSCFNNGSIYDRLNRLWVFDVIERRTLGTLMRPNPVFRAKKKKF